MRTRCRRMRRGAAMPSLLLRCIRFLVTWLQRGGRGCATRSAHFTSALTPLPSLGVSST